MRNRGRPRTLVRAAAATYAVNCATALLSLVNVLVVARALGPAGRGSVAFLIAVALMSGHVGCFSVQEANANLAGSRPELRAALATNSILFALILGGLTAAAVLGLAAAFPAVGGDVAPRLLWLAAAGIPLVMAKLYLSLLVQAEYGFAASNLAWIAGPSTTALFNGALAALGAIEIGSAMAAWVGGQALGVLLLALYVARSSGFGRPDRALARRTLGFGAKAHLGRLMEVGNYRGDQWLLGSVSGAHELGLYSIAVAWVEAVYYIPGVLVLIQRPDLVRATPAAAARLAARVCRSALVVAGVAVATLMVAAPFLCATVFGERFRGSIVDLRVLALGAFGVVVLDLLQSALTAQRRPLLGSAAIGAAFALTIALDLLLIPRYGGLGASVATAVAYTGGGVAAAIIFARAMKARLADLAPRRVDVAWLARQARSMLAP